MIIRRVPNELTSLAGADDRAALLAAIAHRVPRALRHRFEVVMLGAAIIKTFGTKAVAQLFFGDGQVAAPAAQRSFAFGEKLQGRMFAAGHG